MPKYVRVKLLSQMRVSTERGLCKPGRLILGMGTGRSGSTSLTRILSLQKGGWFSHEHPPILPWAIDKSLLRVHIERFNCYLSSCAYSGDVAHWWLPYLEEIFHHFPESKIVCMRRDKQDTVRSFEKIKGVEGRGFNHWIKHDGVKWTKNLWDICYPKYNVSSRKTAIALYWKEYYDFAVRLRRRYPNNIIIVKLSDINSKKGQEKILEFCGIDRPV